MTSILSPNTPLRSAGVSIKGALHELLIFYRKLNVSRPYVPSRTNTKTMFPNDVLAEIFTHVDKLHFVIPRVCANWREVYVRLHNIPQDYEGCDFFSQIDSAAAGTLPPATIDVCAECVYENNVELLKWAGDDGYKPRSIIGVSCAAIALGNLPMLEWAVAHGHRLYDWLSGVAACHDHPHIIEWLCKKGATMTQHAFNIAFEHGSVEIMQHIFVNTDYEEYLEPNYDSLLYRFATDKTLIWLHTRGCIPDITPLDMFTISFHRDLHDAAIWIIGAYPDIVREYTVCQYYDPTVITWLTDANIAAMTAEFLIELITTECPYVNFSKVISYVAEHMPDVLTTDVMDAACQHNLLLVKCLHGAGCLWGVNSLRIACTHIEEPYAPRTHIRMISYMVENGAGTLADALEWLM